MVVVTIVNVCVDCWGERADRAREKDPDQPHHMNHFLMRRVLTNEKTSIRQ